MTDKHEKYRRSGHGRRIDFAVRPTFLVVDFNRFRLDRHAAPPA